MIIGILSLVISIVISVFLANAFADFAEQKGHDRQHYFWFCFFLGVIGYCWVAALRDETMYNELNNLRRPAVAINGEWTCVKCGTSNKAEHGQCKKCGKFRNT